MAVNNNALLVPGTGIILVAPLTNTGVHPAKPTVFPPTSGPWVDAGHVSTDGLTITPDGGDVTTLATWRSDSARTSTAPVSFSVSFTAEQIDNLGLTLYFGGGDTSKAGTFGAPKQSGSVDRSMYIRMLDENNVGTLDIFFFKVTFKQNGEQSYNPEGLATLPLTATVVDDSSETNLFEYYNTQLGTNP